MGYMRDLHPWVQGAGAQLAQGFFCQFPPLCHFHLFLEWQEGSTAVGKVTGAQWVSTATIKRWWHPKADTAALSSAPRKDPEEGHSGGILCSRPNNVAHITAPSQRGHVFVGSLHGAPHSSQLICPPKPPQPALSHHPQHRLARGQLMS